MQTSGNELTPIGYSNNSCGYCKNKSGSFSYYAQAQSLEPSFYLALLDRGWRRSGTLLYKPDLRESCCPQYTIRLHSDSFHASKDQRQVLNRFNKWVLGEKYIKESARLYPKSRAQAKKRNTDFDLIERVHESEEQQLMTPPQPEHAFSVNLESDAFTEEKFALFENYQRVVHHEPPHRITRKSFKNFLCSSPLVSSVEAIDGKERQLGSYHQCYRIDGKLVAVGVLDLLPQCVSAVYFMYHESVHTHGFGKLGALREIALAKEEGYRYWYSGFYIHECIKMRYKADFVPQEILDPVSYSWDVLDTSLKQKLDQNKFVSLSQERAGPKIEVSKKEALEDAMEHEEDTLDSDGDEPPIPHPSLPIFARTMPGLLTKEQLLASIDLDHLSLRAGGVDAETCDLVSWPTSNIDSAHSIKGMIAELVSAVGVELAAQMRIVFD